MMPGSQNVIVVSQHYPPDRSTTAAILAEIAEHLAETAPVLVISGTRGSFRQAGNPPVIEIKNWMPRKSALIRRALAELLFASRTFFALLVKVKRDDVVLTVTAPFLLPYAVAGAARLKKGKSILLLHDLFPEVLVVAGVTGPESLLARALHAANRVMFAALSVVVTIGRDTERLLARYGSAIRDKIVLIPNWATLPAWTRPVSDDNPYRALCRASFVVGLSGNLGFTHDPLVVFEAARLLRDDPNIRFLLSGWGLGFDRLKNKQAEDRLPNVTIVDRVEQQNLEKLLSAADVWIVPYRKNAAGVSIPSRIYNFLAVGRPVVIVSEDDAEAAVIVRENDVGWVVRPDDPDGLAEALRNACRSADSRRAERAVAVAKHYSRERALDGYVRLIDDLLRPGSPVGRAS
jgi:colanic acid biosynthesis glycosyl transferase WcaI